MQISAAESYQTQKSEKNDYLLKYLAKRNIANMYQCNATYWVYPLEKSRHEYMKAPIEEHTPARDQAFLQASEMKNSKLRIFSWLLANKARGFRGICMTNDLLAERIKAAAGCGKLAGRTVSLVMNELAREGWIVIGQLPLRTKVQKPNGQIITKRVNTYEFTDKFKLLFEKPKKSQLNRCKKIESSYISPPSQKMPTTPLGSTVKGGLDRTLPPPSQVPEPSRHPVVTSCADDTNSSRDKVVLTRKASPRSEHKTVQQVRKKRTESQPGRRIRNSRAKNWTALRLAFLNDLQRHLDGSEMSRRILNLAKVQTTLLFPSCLPTPLDWNKVIFAWMDQKYDARQREIKHVILPTLQAAVSSLVPPDKSRGYNPAVPANERMKAREAYRKWELSSAWQQKISSRIYMGDYPESVKAFVRENEFVLDMYQSHLLQGRLRPYDLDIPTHNMFRELADRIGDD